MTATLESRTASIAAALLLSSNDGDELSRHQLADELAEMLCRYLPEVLAFKYPEWRYESLDGISFRAVRRMAARELEALGLCILITDQSTAPFHMKLRLDEAGSSIPWIECRIGELDRTTGRIVREPWNSELAFKRNAVLESRIATVAWAYTCELVSEA